MKMYSTTIWRSQSSKKLQLSFHNIIPPNQQLCNMHPLHRAPNLPIHRRKITMDISQHAALHCTQCRRERRNCGANIHCRRLTGFHVAHGGTVSPPRTSASKSSITARTCPGLLLSARLRHCSAAMDGRRLDLSWPDDDDDDGFMLPLDDDNLQQLQELQAGRIQVYSNPSPNGQKIGVALEEMGLGYDLCTSIPDFIISENTLPAIIDVEYGPQGTPVAVFESGCILMHLARKTGKFLSVKTLSHTFAWLRFLKYIECYDKDVLLLETLEWHLSNGRDFVVGDTFSIADMATFPWILSTRCASLLRYFPVCADWARRCHSRPASSRGMKIFN